MLHFSPLYRATGCILWMNSAVVFRFVATGTIHNGDSPCLLLLHLLVKASYVALAHTFYYYRQTEMRTKTITVAHVVLRVRATNSNLDNDLPFNIELVFLCCCICSHPSSNSHHNDILFLRHTYCKHSNRFPSSLVCWLRCRRFCITYYVFISILSF